MFWKKSETDLDRELSYHLETLADTYESQGLSRKEAMRKARAEFGGVEKIKDECRDENRWNWLAQAPQDVKFGLRMMRKTPTTTTAAILSLALGIGATTAILTLADALLWRTIGVPAPEQLTEVLWVSKDRAEGLHRASSGSMYPDNGMRVADFFSKQSYESMRSRAAGKAEIAAHTSSDVVSASYSGSVVTARLRGVTGNFFSMLQLRSAAGRLFLDSDNLKGATPVIVVTDRFRRRYRAAAPRIQPDSRSIRPNAAGASDCRETGVPDGGLAVGWLWATGPGCVGARNSCMKLC
jgi:hypothetical protein